MRALAVYSGDDGQAAALAQDGRLIGAVSADTPVSRDNGNGGLPFPLIAECLRAARVEPADIAQLICVDPGLAGTRAIDDAPPTRCTRNHEFRGLADGLSRTPTARIPPLLGHALQIRALDSCTLAVIIDRSGGAAARLDRGRVSELRGIPGIESMWCLAARLATAFGLDDQDALRQLEAVAAGAAPETARRVSSCVSLSADLSVTVAPEALDALLREVRERCPVPLEAAGSAHVELQRLRGAVAGALLDRFAEVVAAIAARWSATAGGATPAFGGSAFAQPEFAARVTSRLPGAAMAAVTEGIGTAIGAALMPFDAVQPLEHLALGGTYDEQHIKNVLDNCRLDYVYEPNWERLFDRVSGILASGALVGWFNGPADFGVRSLGSRSVLCDPSKPYARENVNVFLLNRPDKHTIPVSLAPSAQGCLAGPVAERLSYTEAQVSPSWRPVLKAALDSSGACRAHVPAIGHPELTRLLERHFARTNVPGLLNVSLGHLGSPLTIDPRAAVRAMFGSAIDVLAMGRFLVSKDYWLVRAK